MSGYLKAKDLIEWECRVMQLMSSASLNLSLLINQCSAPLFACFLCLSQVMHIELRKSEAGAETQQILCGE